MSKPKLCLNMIVKNESHVIKETLENVYKYIDYYVINDTGSTDNTKEIIKEFFDSKGIKGEVVSHEFRSCQCHMGKWKRYSFFHFGWNRTYALKCCEGKSDYIWIFDADDLVIGDFKVPELTEDSYNLTYGSGFTYKRTQIVKNDPTYNWHYVDALHEYLTCSKPNFTKGNIEGNYYIDSRRLGARNQDPQKYLRDAKVFEELLVEEPKNERRAFYCAQSWYDHGDLNAAIKWYQKRIDMGGWYEEVFYSYYRIAMAKETLKLPWKEVEQAYLDAHNYCKIRSEPLYNITKYYRLNGDLQNAYKYAKKCVKIPYPSQCVLFIFKDVYDYKIHDELAVICYQLGKYHEAYTTLKNILDQDTKNIPNDELTKLKTNLKNCEEKMRDKEKKTCCIYTSNEIINDKSQLFHIVDQMKNIYNLILVGDKIDTTCFNNFMIVTISDLKQLQTKLSVDYLILYNAINYNFDQQKIDTQTTILLQTDATIKYIFENGLCIGYYNNAYLEPIMKNINKIVCVDRKVKNKLANDYKIPNENIVEIDPNDINNFYLLSNGPNYQYHPKPLINNDTNGLLYFEPDYFKQFKNSINTHKFARDLLFNIYNNLIKKFPQSAEHQYKLAGLHIELYEYDTALKTLEIAEKNNTNKNFADVISLAKSKVLSKLNKYEESYKLAEDVMRRDLIPQIIRQASEEIRDLNVEFIKDATLLYPQNKVNKIKNKQNTTGANTNKVLFSITTCKRFDLFEKTMNSFINCCQDLDLIDTWLCVDDNSSEQDRAIMKKKYPFFTFIFKDPSQKGHYISMNIIRDYALEHMFEYNLHTEDDWHYVQKRYYISDAIKVLAENQKYGQVLFNKNYAEIELYKRKMGGGIIKKTKDGMVYVVHEHYEPGSKEYKEYENRNQGLGTNGYWPHFSFRPSLLRVNMLNDVGSFYNTGHFEMQYAKEYIQRGYQSTFFDSFTCIHLGKKTWEHNGQNSYHLNQTGQFKLNEDAINISVISNNTIDYWKTFKENAKDKLTSINRHIPRNVTKLEPYEVSLFNGNVFNYLRPIINKIISHIDLLKNNQSQYLMILHDYLVLNEQFNLNDILNKKANYDMILFEQTKLINLETLPGYLLSKTGIQKILEYITSHGIKDNKYLEGITLNILIYDKKVYTVSDIPKEEINNGFKPLEGYKFYSQLDSFGEDIGYFGGKSVEELKEICDKEGGTAFNTIGYVKKKYCDEKDFIFLPTSTTTDSGMYVKV